MESAGKKRRLDFLLKEIINGLYGFKTDAVSFCDCCFVVLVFTRYYLPTQGTQLCKLYLQLGG
jgi:hypothetical protein